MTLTVVMVTYNSADVVEGALRSVSGLWDELLVGDGGSTDGTVKIVKKYGGRVFKQDKTGSLIRSGMTRKNLGERKQELVEKTKGDWVLVLDADERVSEELKEEIGRLRDSKTGRQYAAYRIPYQNYVFGRPVYYGGEKYVKVRLFRRGYARVSPGPLHEEVVVRKGAVGQLRGVIHHHSYRTPWQLITKFTRYAWIASGMVNGPVTRKKLSFYGPHMFWARFIKEKGYKDGWRGLVLDAAFGYMEGLTYWFAFLKKIL